MTFCNTRSWNIPMFRLFGGVSGVGVRVGLIDWVIPREFE
jgi:hypothetical protein